MKFPPYHENNGLPYYWRMEQTGRLAAAVDAYFNNRVNNAPISHADCQLVKTYISHWINAPVWDWKPQTEEDSKAELAKLRQDAASLTDADSIDRWIHVALDWGIDPF